MIDHNLASINEHGTLWCAAELRHRRGQLLLEHGSSNQLGAEAEFRQAIDIARGQSAKWWELRAATSLARLWRDQGKTREANALLGPTYSWFTEGFDLPDLNAAKTLLDELGWRSDEVAP